MTDDHRSTPPDRTEAAPAAVTTETVECSVCQFESFEYHPEDDVYRALFDADVVSPSTAVVGAVSTVSTEDPLDIEPLYSSLDPDAFDTLVSHQPFADGDVHVEFDLAGYDITVSSYGSVTIQPSPSVTA